MRVDKKCEYLRSASREGMRVKRSASREGVRVEKRCEWRMSASREKRVQKMCE